VIDHLRQHARPFVFSTAAPPAVAAAIDASLDLLVAEAWRRTELAVRVQFVRDRLNAAGIKVEPSGSQIVPIAIGDNELAVVVARALQAEGFDVRAIRPPTVPKGTARLRLSINVGLSEAALERFALSLAAALREVGLCSAESL
jgi:8-amino-7-oxononanoate synthase